MDKQILSIFRQVADGNLSALDTYMQFKQIHDVLTACIDSLKEPAVKEASSYGKGTHERLGTLFKIQECGTTYNYSEYEEWVKLKNEITELEKKLRQGFLDKETGELFPCVSKKSTTSIIRYENKQIRIDNELK